MTKLFNKNPQKELRRKLRNEMPPAEIILWSKIKNKQVNGYKFRRQYGIEKFIVDFYCPKLKLAIELDGESHSLGKEKEEYDIERQTFIESKGIHFLRFTNKEIYKNLDRVLETIINATYS